jgi:tRNA pseudouridine55 synthase
MIPNNGFLFIAKPRGITSSQLVQKIKKKYNFAKLGHTGTLDKSAEGLMILPYNKYTCFSEKLLGKDKDYFVSIKPGIFTDSGDLDGEVLNSMPEGELKKFFDENYNLIQSSILDIKKWTSQVPPKISALKKDGKRYSDLFRNNTFFEVKERPILVYFIEDINISYLEISFKIGVSSGTYIRKIVQDLSDNLKIPLVISKLVRSKIGSFILNNSQKLENLENNEELKVFSLDDIYPLKYFEVEDLQVRKVTNGNNLEIPLSKNETEFFLINNGRLLAWCQNIPEKNTYKYLKVF